MKSAMLKENNARLFVNVEKKQGEKFVMLKVWFLLMLHCVWNWHDIGFIYADNNMHILVFCTKCEPELKKQLNKIIRARKIEQEG